jgi:isoleucyl-tRNA synthetase
MEAVESYDELLAKPGISGTEVWEAAKKKQPKLPEDLKVHKPYIDSVTYDSPFAKGAKMQRVTEVIDCWFDSGAMPFAQWGYPHENREFFESQFPADFISEALDQTRGWFYSLLAISTLMFGPKDDEHAADAEPHRYPHPFRNCIVLGLMLGEDGGKMSKSKRNYREPAEIFDRYGADAMRWYLFANQAPWTSIRYSERAIKDSIPEFLLRLWNVFSFFVIYANIDGFDPGQRIKGDVGQVTTAELRRGEGFRPVSERGELDRWVLSELHKTSAEVVERMDAYDSYAACGRLSAFVDALSNWYVRRSRDRFWSGDKQSIDKLDAYWTLLECLLSTSKLIAPFVPFVAEHLWRHLTRVFDGRAVESVHLCDYPDSDGKAIDQQLSQQMMLAREISSLGRSARMNSKLKVRQPLAKVEVILADDEHFDWLQDHANLIKTELNVKDVDFTQDAEMYIEYQIQPNFKRLGPRVGKLMPQVKKTLAQADGGELMRELNQDGKIVLSCDGQQLELDGEDVQIRLQAREGWAAAQGEQCVVVLSTELTPELILEGLARDAIRFIQDERKKRGCEYTDRIVVRITTDSEELSEALTKNLDYVRNETLAVDLVIIELDEGKPPIGEAMEIGPHRFYLTVEVK